MLYNDIRVPMPKNKVLIKTRGQSGVYVYYNLRSFRNKKSQPASEQVTIGKKDITTGQLIPNQRYFLIFPDQKPPNIQLISDKTQHKLQKHKQKKINKQSTLNEIINFDVKICGVSATMMSIAQRSGLLSIIKECFPDNWGDILVTAFYMISEGNVMMYMEDWFDMHKINFTDRMNGVSCSRLFESISEEERRLFFSWWIKQQGKQDYIAYDVTSISTYSKNIEIAEWGYNRDNDKLPQINYGMFYGASSQSPLYYNTYSGSIPDKVCLDYMVSQAKDFGIENVCLVIDRGFMTNDNLFQLTDHKYTFITALPSTRNEFKQLITDVHEEIESTKNWNFKYNNYSVSRPISINGVNLTAHIYLDLLKKSADAKDHYHYLQKLEKELALFEKSKQVPRRFYDYFSISGDSKNSFTYVVDNNKIDEKLKRHGFFIILCFNHELSSEETLRIYRERDCIEKHFDMFKNDLEFKRLKTHSDQNTEGKLFVGFIALILRSYLLNSIKNDKETKALTFEKTMLALRKIISVKLSNGKVMLKTLNKTQKNILNALGVDIKTLIGE